jgi:hypothetical protein
MVLELDVGPEFESLHRALNFNYFFPTDVVGLGISTRYLSALTSRAMQLIGFYENPSLNHFVTRHAHN